MVVSQARFGMVQQLPPKPVMNYMVIESNVLNDIMLTLTWTPNDSQMDTGADPSPAHFRLLVDGVPRAIDLLQWAVGNDLSICALGAPADQTFTFIQDAYDANVRNLDGVHAVAGGQVIAQLP